MTSASETVREAAAKLIEATGTPHSACKNAIGPNIMPGMPLGHQSENCPYRLAAAIRALPLPPESDALEVERDAKRWRFLRTRIGHQEQETLSPVKRYYRRWYHDTAYRPDAATQSEMFDAAIDEAMRAALHQDKSA